jgi:hypothetical protein
MNAPEVKQIIRLVMAKTSLPVKFAICVLIPTSLKESTITVQILKPIMDAPTKMNVALLS